MRRLSLGHLHHVALHSAGVRAGPTRGVEPLPSRLWPWLQGLRTWGHGTQPTGALAVGETLSAHLFAALLRQRGARRAFRDVSEVLHTDGRFGQAGRTWIIDDLVDACVVADSNQFVATVAGQRALHDEVDLDHLVSWPTFPERLESLGVSWKVYQNELTVETGLSEEEDAWLANFGDNPLEYFSQYQVHLLPAAEKLALYDAIRAGNVPPGVAQNIAVSGWLKLCSGVVYSALTVRVTLAHRRAIRARYSTLDRITLDWLLTLAVTSVMVWGIAVLARFGESAGVVTAGLGDHLIVLLMTGSTYVLGYRGLHQGAVPLSDEPPEGVTTRPLPLEAAPTPDKVERSTLTPGMARTLEERLHAVMREDAPWRDPGC